MISFDKNKKLWFGVIVLIIIILLALFYIIYSRKDISKMIQRLENNNYSIYYNYGGNYYDKNNICYDYDYSKEQECKRETTYFDYSIIDIVNNRDKDYKFSLIVYYNNEYDITDISLSYNYQEDEDISCEYVYHMNGKKEYFVFSNGTNFYYKIIKYDEDCSNFMKVTKRQEIELDNFFNDYKNVLKEIGLTNETLINFAKWYFETSIKEQIINSKTELNKGLTLREIKEIVEDKFEVEKLGASVSLKGKR